MPKVWNIRDPNCPPDAVYIGRAVPRLGLKASIWGNPYTMPVPVARDEAAEARRVVVAQYRRWLLCADEASPLRKRIVELWGKDLKCFCAPLPCHGDVLLELANAERDPVLDWCWRD